jgi:E1A-binding protein p400
MSLDDQSAKILEVNSDTAVGCLSVDVMKTEHNVTSISLQSEIAPEPCTQQKLCGRE